MACQMKSPTLLTAANSLQQKPGMAAIYFFFFSFFHSGFPEASVNVVGFGFEVNAIFK